MVTSAEILGPEGPLKNILPGFSARTSQQQMATRVEETIAHRGTLIAESGPGTGKTLAYLVPAFLSRKKTLISTGTKHLQDQLCYRDIPLVRQAVAVPADVALLKGRANYLCLDRYHRVRTTAPDLSPAEQGQIQELFAWCAQTRTGEISEVASIPEDAAIWPLLTSTNDNCLGGQCEYFDQCYVMQARKSALKAEILIVNHHLFFADLALREDGFGNLLPGVDSVVFDEAHQLPEVASSFLGKSISGHQLLELCRDARAEEAREQSLVGHLEPQIRKLERCAADLRRVLGDSGRRMDWKETSARPRFRAVLSGTIEALAGLGEILREAAAAGEGLSRCWVRCSDLHGRLCEMSEDPRGLDSIRWAETTARGFRFQETPVDTGKILRAHLRDAEKAWIFTSATLSVAGDFSHYQRLIGVEDVDTEQWTSPFDFAQQALLYVPHGLPDPRDPAYTSAMIENTLPVLEASDGRAFLLFTSYRAMHEAQQLLERNNRFSVLVQGSAPKTELLQRFRKHRRAVLLGTASFWEGVDVRGDALSCVVIDKLPFESPDDPVLRARLRAIEENGGNPFMEHQLPNAVIALRQGIGRLIRDVTDRGVLMLCDPRLLSKNYGALFLRACPAMPLTRDLETVRDFFGAID